jgi:predicted esterase YcpF (UPF0227 family)
LIWRVALSPPRISTGTSAGVIRRAGWSWSVQAEAKANSQSVCAVIAKGDELLDWREMATRYRGATIRLLERSDHALSDFAEHLPFVLGFLGFAARG